MSDLAGFLGARVPDRCPWCRRPAGPYEDCCPAKARWRIEISLLAKRLYPPARPLIVALVG